MRVFLGSDHAGYELKERLKRHLTEEGYDVTDVGTTDGESVDYPDYALDVARAVRDGKADRGVLVCGTGIGMAIAANKVTGVRAAAVTEPELAEMARLHNNANVIAVAGRYTPEAKAIEIVDRFLATEFEGGRHQRRVDKIAAVEDERRR